MLRNRKSFKGQLFMSYLLVYALLRFTVEFFRGDVGRGFIMENISVSQGISILMFFIGIAGFVILRGKSRKF